MMVDRLVPPTSDKNDPEICGNPANIYNRFLKIKFSTTDLLWLKDPEHKNKI